MTTGSALDSSLTVQVMTTALALALHLAGRDDLIRYTRTCTYTFTQIAARRRHSTTTFTVHVCTDHCTYTSNTHIIILGIA